MLRTLRRNPLLVGMAASDQRRYFVPCPHCHEHQTLGLQNLRWPEPTGDSPPTASTP